MKYTIVMDRALYEPTGMFGDNEAASSLTKEDFISTGNPYIYIKVLVREGA